MFVYFLSRTCSTWQQYKSCSTVHKVLQTTTCRSHATSPKWHRLPSQTFPFCSTKFQAWTPKLCGWKHLTNVPSSSKRSVGFYFLKRSFFFLNTGGWKYSQNHVKCSRPLCSLPGLQGQKKFCGCNNKLFNTFQIY